MRLIILGRPVDMSAQRQSITAAPTVETASAAIALLASEARDAIERGRRADALDRLIDAETLAAGDGADWPVRRSLACCYRRLRMYELALPHLQDAPPAERFRLAELHLIWADELDQSSAEDATGSADSHRQSAQLILASLQLPAPRSAFGPDHGDGFDIDGSDGFDSDGFDSDAFDSDGFDVGQAAGRVRMIAALAAECRLATEPAWLDRLPTEPDPQLPPATIARGLAARCRAATVLGRSTSALALGRDAVRAAATADDPSAARTASMAHHRAQVATGDPTAMAVDPLMITTARSLWRERSTALDVARLRRDSALLDERREAARQLAGRDPLTSLANRERLDEWLADHPVGPMTLVIADLASFKPVNDDFGHLVGDRILTLVAEALTTALPGRLICRFGGDEFVVADDTADRLQATMQAIRQALSEPAITALLGRPLAGVQLGWAVRGPGDGTAGLLAEADQRLRLDKQGRRR